MANNNTSMKALASSSTSYTQTLQSIFFFCCFHGFNCYSIVIHLVVSYFTLVSLPKRLHVVTMATASIISIMLSFAHIWKSSLICISVYAILSNPLNVPHFSTVTTCKCPTCASQKHHVLKISNLCLMNTNQWWAHTLHTHNAAAKCERKK